MKMLVIKNIGSKKPGPTKKNSEATRRRIAVFLIVALIAGFGGGSHISYADSHEQDMRAVWLTTHMNLDFPKVKNDAAAQKKELIQRLDSLKELGINTIVFQVRPKGDALYASSINPWSDVLTGTQGQNPGYDPLAFAISEAHKRGMSLHAWLNPYRITTSGTEVTALAANHPARLHPEWTIAYKDALYYNPELPAVEKHICDTVAEIVSNYDVDGIHFDDYFYPSNYPLPQGETKDGATANKRRAYVNQMVAAVYKTIKDKKPAVLFGISPIGVWKNNTSDPAGSATSGGEGYYSVYGDAAAWVKAGTVDYLVPQIYWEIGHTKADYETLVDWWSRLVKDSPVKLYIGEAVYRETVAPEITKHLDICKKYPQVKGNFYFRGAFLWDNYLGCKDNLKAYYANSGSVSVPDPTPAKPEPPAPMPPLLPTFPDVPAGEWFAPHVEIAVSLGIIRGMDTGKFEPSGNLTVAQALTMAVKYHSQATGTIFIEGGAKEWYDNAVTYAFKNGIMKKSGFSDYNKSITREEMAYLFRNALPPSDTTLLNEKIGVPDIKGSAYETQIRDLYERGILTGSGTDRAFLPKNSITRAEAAAIIHRAAASGARVKF